MDLWIYTVCHDVIVDYSKLEFGVVSRCWCWVKKKRYETKMQFQWSYVP